LLVVVWLSGGCWCGIFAGWWRWRVFARMCGALAIVWMVGVIPDHSGVMVLAHSEVSPLSLARGRAFLWLMHQARRGGQIKKGVLQGIGAPPSLVCAFTWRVNAGKARWQFLTSG
jgi:hypothetical protein